MSTSSPQPLKIDEKRSELYRKAHLQFIGQQRSPSLAFILSFLLTGIGQFYNGDRLRGLILAVFYIICASLSVLFTWPVLIWIPFWVWGMFNARKGAQRKNRALLDYLSDEIIQQQQLN
ncbi:hypothetical protein [Acidihalobacter prosperus]